MLINEFSNPDDCMQKKSPHSGESNDIPQSTLAHCQEHASDYKQGTINLTNIVNPTNCQPPSCLYRLKYDAVSI